MIISNKKKVTFLKRLFFLVSVLIALAALVLFLLDFTLYGIGAVGVFALWFLYFQVADYQFIEFRHEGNRIILRYFKAVRFGSTEYNSIEFPQQILYRAYFENSIFGKMSDLVLVVKTKRGIAEYPSVSFTAVPKKDRRKVQDELLTILGA
jgi:hypothetical protein